MNDANKQSVPPAAIHVDLDGARDIFRSFGWPYPNEDDPVFATGLRGALDVFDACGIRATLFLIADSLDRPEKLALVKEALARGHDIASHTVTHPNLLQVDRTRQQEEIARSREKIEGVLGVSVRGFRAPGYRLDRQCLEMLAAAGYTYDASAFPTGQFAGRFQTRVERLTAPHHPLPESPLLELPLPDHRPWPVPFNPSYSHLFGLWFFRWGLERQRRRGLPLVMLFHLIDFADPLPARMLNGWRSRVFTLSNQNGAKKRERCRRMLEMICQRFRVLTTDGFLQEVKAQIAAAPAGP